jgi:O-antigen ligase
MMKKMIRFNIYLAIFLQSIVFIKIPILGNNLYIEDIFIFSSIVFLFLYLVVYKKITKIKISFIFSVFLINIIFLVHIYNTDLLFVSFKNYYLLLKPFLLFFIIINSFEDNKNVKNVILLLVLAGIISASIGLFEYFNNSTILSNVHFFDGQVRVIGPIGGPNTFGNYLMQILPLSLYLLFSAKKNQYLRKIFYFAGTLLLIFIVIVTYSRGALLAMIISLIFYGIILKSKTIIIFILFSPIILLTMFSESFGHLINAFTTGGSGRIEIYINELNNIFSNILFGNGFDYYLSGSAHNIILQIVSQIGLIGLGLFIIVFIFILLNNYLLILKNYHTRNHLGISLISSQIGFLFHGLFESVLTSTRINWIFGLIFGLIYVLNINNRKIKINEGMC